MSERFLSIKKIGTSLLAWAVLFSIAVTVSSAGCTGIKKLEPDANAVKVAKVDTDYIYESSVITYVANFQMSRRASVSNFVGFTPDEILKARENGIDKEVRDAVKRLPGVNVANKTVTDLATKREEELAWTLYRKLTDEKADFATLAREYSSGLAARDGGLLPPFSKTENAESYQERAYAMKIGDISEPFSAWDGWRIIRLESVKDDSILGKQYTVSMILLQPDFDSAEAEIVGKIAKEHTIEILDPKYNSRRALEAGDFASALNSADEAIKRNERDDLAHYLKARALWGLDRKDEALSELQTAIDTSRVSEALAPYYQFFRGEYLQKLDRIPESLLAFHQSFDIWRQDITLAYKLLDKFKELGDTEYAAKIQDEINIIAQQDAAVLAIGSRRAKGEDIIITGEGQSKGSSTQYEPGYEGKSGG
jgi:hypothetical protein